MTVAGAPRPDQVLGEAAKPPFVRLPDPEHVFVRRAERFRTLAPGHHLKPYLLFLADLCTVQHGILEGLPAVELPDLNTLARAREHGMPALDRGRFTADTAWDVTLERLLPAVFAREMPAEAKSALLKVRGADPAMLAEMTRAVLTDAVPVEAIAEHAFVAAALQVHFARLAAGLDAAGLVEVGDGVCPACGGPPVSSLVVGWPGAQGTRYCACGLCGTMWNYVRIKCTACGSTRDIDFQEIDGSAGTIKAETCGDCRSYLKVLYHQKDPAVDPIADDVASLGLDLLVRETGLRRSGVNPFLLGY